MKHNLMADVFNHNVKAREIIAEFCDGRNARYTINVFDLLKTDDGVKCIIDAETGEILFDRVGD